MARLAFIYPLFVFGELAEIYNDALVLYLILTKLYRVPNNVTDAACMFVAAGREQLIFD